MEQRILAGLDGKELLRIADVRAQILGHSRKRFENSRENIVVSLDERVGGVANVEMHLPVVSIDGRLDGIAHVIPYSLRRV